MNTGKTLFNQLISLSSKYEFQKALAVHGDKYKGRKFSAWDHFLTMAFAQVTQRESLRDIEATLRAAGSKCYHLGIRARVSRSTLSEANEKRDWRIFEEFGKSLIKEAQAAYSGTKEFEELMVQAMYAMDSTNIDLCLSLFPWAQYCPELAAVRVDTVLDLNGNFPCFIQVSTRKTSEISAMDLVTIQPGSFYVFDRGFFDWSRLHRFSSASAFFLIRAKADIKYKRQKSQPILDKTSGVNSDQIILPYSPRARKDYPATLRRITFTDKDTGRKFIFLTNNFLLAPETIATLYKSRWQIELFFKWMKQHLRIKAFYGTSFNAIKIQIWVAISIFLLLAIAKKRLKLTLSLYTFAQVLSVVAFDKDLDFITIDNIYSNPHIPFQNPGSFQLDLFDFPTGQ